MLAKQETLLRSGAWVEGRRVREHWLAVLGFIVMGLVSRLPLANHPDSGSSWWYTRRSRSTRIDYNEEDSGRWQDMCISL